MIRRRQKKDGTPSYQVIVSPFPAKTVSTWKDAQTVHADLIRRKSLGELYVERPTLLRDEIERHIGQKVATVNLREPTVRSYREMAKMWSPLAMRTVASLRRSEIEEIIAKRCAKHPRSAQGELQFLKTVLKDAENRGQRVDRSIFSIPAIKRSPKIGKALTYEELIELASHAPEYIYRMILFAGTTALRWRSLVTLTDDRVDLANGRVFIPPELIKTGRPLNLSLTDSETALLREQLLARPPRTQLVFPTKTGKRWRYHSNYRSSVWLPALERASAQYRRDHDTETTPYDGLTFHHLRHTATSLMRCAGMPIELVAERRGDADAGGTALKVYRHIYPNEMVEAVRSFDLYLTKPGSQSGQEADKQ
jgi:integrase